MPKPKSSCMKKLGIGCAGIVILVLLLLVLFSVGLALNKPEPQELTTLNIGETIAREGDPLDLPDARVESKPVRVSLDLVFLEFDLIPSENGSEIQIESNYDKANFDLTTNIEEHPEYIDYRVSFKNKRSLLGMAWASRDGDNDFQNDLKVLLPKNLLYELNMKMEMGDFDVDLTGLAVRSLDVEMSKGELEIEMTEDNPIPMEKLAVRVGMGEFKLRGLNHLGSREGFFKGSMGEMRLSSLGPFREDMDLTVNMSLGEARLVIPENVALESSFSAFMGSLREPSALDSSVSDAKQLRLRGGIRLGEMRVIRGAARGERTRVLRELLENQNVEAMISEARRIRENSPAHYEISRSSINSMGYRLLRRDRVADAVEVFKLNVELYPDYANGYDSLGEAYLKAGDPVTALANYERALELDPDDDRVRNIVEKLKSGEEL